MKSRRIRILVVEDQFLVRAGLRASFDGEDDLELVGEADSGDSGLEQFRALKPDVTVMDLRLPGMDGVDTTAAIRRESPQAKILVLTGSDSSDDIHRALQAGARAYLFKGVGRAELLKAVRDVADGRRVIPQDVASRLAERAASIKLTARERDVLRLIAGGMSTRAIATELALTEGTVRNHVSAMLVKLGVSGRAQAVAAALKQGLLPPS